MSDEHVSPALGNGEPNRTNATDEYGSHAVGDRLQGMSTQCVLRATRLASYPLLAKILLGSGGQVQPTIRIEL